VSETQLAQLAELAASRALAKLAQLPSDRIAYPIAEAARVVGLPRNTLDDARSRGEFKAVKRCGKWMVTRAELLRWLDAQ
jgi:hypothetical protein